MQGRIEDYQHYLPMNVRVLYNVRSVIRETFWRQVYKEQFRCRFKMQICGPVYKDEELERITAERHTMLCFCNLFVAFKDFFLDKGRMVLMTVWSQRCIEDGLL